MKQHWLWCAVWLVASPILAVPIITGLKPAFGPSGTQVSVEGYGFSSAVAVEFDDILADFTVTTNGLMMAVVPPAATTGRIRVTDSLGGSGISGADFRVPPRLSHFNTARAAPGKLVTIFGENFSDITNVQFNGVNAVFSTTGDTQLEATVPPGASNGPVRVESVIGFALSTVPFQVIGPEPIVDSFSIGGLPIPYGAPGDWIKIHGVNFNNLTGVFFSGAWAVEFSDIANDQINVRVPASAQTGPVTVFTTAGAGASPIGFVVTRLPVITRFWPASRGNGALTPVFIEGINFNGLSGVWFNNTPATSYSTTAAGLISVQIPFGASTGPITVANGVGYGISAEHFVITAAPLVSSFDPPLGGVGTRVAIRGENLSNPTAVAFNGVLANYSQSAVIGEIYAWVPGTAASGPIAVYNQSGVFVTSSNFTVTPSFPYITRYSPEGGPCGTEVTIYGLNFGNPPTVLFNGVPDPTARFEAMVGNEAKLVALVPPGATTGRLTVMSASGASTNESWFHLPPRLKAFSAASGFVGDTLTLEGTNFFGTTSVRVNSAEAPFQVESGGIIAATIPADALTGLVSMVTPGGILLSTNAFSVLPRITNFTPSAGAIGTAVTIRGATLHQVSSVKFNGVAASFTNPSLSEVTAVVPGGTSTGLISIETPDGIAPSSLPFLVTGPTDLVLANQAAPRLIQPIEAATYTLTVSNAGPWTVTGVQLTGSTPAGLQFPNVQTDRGNCSLVNGQVNCEFGSMNRTEQAEVVVTGILTTEGYASLTATVSANEVDPDFDNNTGTSTVAVGGAAARTLSISRPANTRQVVLSWPDSATEYDLLSATNLNQAVWKPVTNSPARLGGRQTVTNSIGSSALWYRLQLRIP